MREKNAGEGQEKWVRHRLLISKRLLALLLLNNEEHIWNHLCISEI